jgi:hypothetical protein
VVVKKTEERLLLERGFSHRRCLLSYCWLSYEVCPQIRSPRKNRKVVKSEARGADAAARAGSGRYTGCRRVHLATSVTHQRRRQGVLPLFIKYPSPVNTQDATDLCPSCGIQSESDVGGERRC